MRTLKNYGFLIACLLTMMPFTASDVRAQNNGEWTFDLRTILPPPEAIPREGARAVETRRQYPPGGTCDLGEVYGVNKDRDYTLRELGYSEQAARDSFPTFAAFWDAKAWPMLDMLDLYEYECAWNDWVWHTDTYLAIGPYIRANFVTQSRGMILSPDGWYRLAFGCQTGIGRYIGKHAQVYSDRTGQNPGCTPGTALEIDHAHWSKHAPDRVCLNATAWGKDYGVIGGMAYTEGIVIENFRVVGNRSAYTGTAFCTGITLNEPGENSRLEGCMAESFPGSGYSIFNGTPFDMTDCSAFNNRDAGADFLGSNGLCNVRVSTLSGDNNEKGLARIRPKDAQSVGGGTFVFTSTKSEARNILQRPIVIEGAMGDLNLVIDGLTANFEGVTCDYLIGGTWTGNQFEVNARGVDLRSNTQALFRHSGKGWTLIGGRPFSGNSFVVNDEGLVFRSRANMVLNTGTVTPPGSWGCTSYVEGACVAGKVIRTRTCTCGGGTCPADTKPAERDTIACGVPAPVVTATAFSTNPACTCTPDKAVDGNGGTFWQAKTAIGAGQVFEVDLGALSSKKSVTFSAPYSQFRWWPVKYLVHTSTDGITWTQRKNPATATTDGAWPGQYESTATWTATNVKKVRITSAAAYTDGTGNWWAISELVVK